MSFSYLRVFYWFKRLGGLLYFAGAEKRDEKVLVPDLGSLTSIYDRWVHKSLQVRQPHIAAFFFNFSDEGYAITGQEGFGIKYFYLKLSDNERFLSLPSLLIF